MRDTLAEHVTSRDWNDRADCPILNGLSAISSDLKYHGGVASATGVKPPENCMA